jgi:hypothetical protein
MARRIFSINEGLITFVGDKGEEVAGSSEDCRMVGGKYTGTACVLPNVGHNDNLTNNRNILGQGNTIDNEALNNNVIGDKNTIGNVENTHTIGKFAHATRQGEYTQAFTTATGRTQRSVLMFEGTTTDANYTEIFLGGQSGKRFIVDETKECVIGFEGYVIGMRVDSGGLGEMMNKFQHATFEYSSSTRTLTQAGSTGTKTNNKNHSSSWNNRYVATSGTPDYIKVECKGVAGATIHWSVILHVFELKTSAI